MTTKHILAAAAIAGLAAVPAAASAAPTTTQTAYSIDITGIHVVDWSDQPGEKVECRAWSAGSGTQTIGFSTPRKLRYTGLILTGRRPFPVPRFQLVPAGLGRVKATVTRTGEWTDHVIPQSCTPCGPGSEYGECEPTAAVDPATLLSCGRRTIRRASATVVWSGKGEPIRGDGDDDLLTPLTDALTVSVGASAQGLYRLCPPDLPDGAARALRTPDPQQLTIVGSRVQRLKRLAVGRTLTLKVQQDAGYAVPVDGTGKASTTCPKLGGPGYAECATTDITVEITRTR